jgi:hypothetical protein
MATDEKPILPGDVVQVTDKESPLFGALATVYQVKGWGIGAQVAQFGPGAIGVIPLRLKTDHYARIGAAVFMDPDIAAARADCIATGAQ